MNLGCLAFLVLGLFTLLFVLDLFLFSSSSTLILSAHKTSRFSFSRHSAGYPIITAFTGTTTTTTAGFNLGGVNGSGQVPETVGNFGLIDADTPTTAYSITSATGETWELVFSDECQSDTHRNLLLLR